MQYDLHSVRTSRGFRVYVKTAECEFDCLLTAPEGAAEDGEWKITLGQFAAKIMRLSDAYTHAASKGYAIACQKGCGACCRQLITISPAEALMIGDLVEGDAGDLEDRFAVAERAIAESEIGPRLSVLSDPRFSNEGHYHFARDYFRMKLACPFLVDESCIAYGHRPSLCREYHVTSHPSRCQDPFDVSPDRVPVSAWLGEALSALCADLMGGEMEFIPLPFSVRWANEHKEWKTNAYDYGDLLKSFLIFWEIILGGSPNETPEPLTIS